MNHYHRGDEVLPKMYEKWQEKQNPKVGVHIQTGAGPYEDKFRLYWLVTAWLFMAYQAMAMCILLYDMATVGASYNWLPHVVGTAIIIPSLAALACIYRFILFPQPGYYSYGAQEDDEAARYYSSSGQWAPPSYTAPTVVQPRETPREGFAA